MLMYIALSGLSQEFARLSAEGTAQSNGRYMSWDKKLSPEGVLSTNDGRSPSLMNRMKDISISPFQGLGLSWRWHFIGQHPMLMYIALSGLSQEFATLSPEGMAHANGRYMSWDKKLSPEGVLSINDGRSPSHKNKNKNSPERV